MFSLLQKSKESERMMQLVENVDLDTEEGRESFMTFLQAQSPWIHEEILIELRAETGNLPVDEAEVEDASFIVHRHFGTSRRFAEQDKRTMTSLVATKGQVTKEVWSRRLAETKRELETLQKEIEEREKLIRSTNETLKTFVKRNELGLFDFSAEGKSTTEILRSAKERSKEDAVSELARRTNFVLQRFGRLLVDRQSLTKQKQECLDILETADHSTPLHSLIRDTIRHLSKENESSRSQVKSLKLKAVNLEDQLNHKDIELEELREEINILRSNSRPSSGSAAVDGQQAINATRNMDTSVRVEPKEPIAKPTRLEPLIYPTKEVSKNKLIKPILPSSTVNKHKNTVMRPKAQTGKSKRCLLEV